MNSKKRNGIIMSHVSGKGNMAVNYTFLLVLALVILVVLVGLSFFLGDRAKEIIESVKSLIPKSE